MIRSSLAFQVLLIFGAGFAVHAQAQSVFGPPQKPVEAARDATPQTADLPAPMAPPTPAPHLSQLIDPFTDTFVAAGPAAVSSHVALGGTAIEIPVDYLHTGVLREEVRPTSLFGISFAKPVPAGAPVFGLPHSLGTGIEPSPTLMWCAVTTLSTSSLPWKVTCFAKTNTFGIVRMRMLELGPTYFPSAVSFRSADPASDVRIDIKRLALHPPLSVIYQFAGWDDNKANFRVSVHGPKAYDPMHIIEIKDYIWDRLHLPRDASGAAHLQVLGGEALIRPAPDGKGAIIDVVQPFQP